MTPEQSQEFKDAIIQALEETDEPLSVLDLEELLWPSFKHVVKSHTDLKRKITVRMQWWKELHSGIRREQLEVPGSRSKGGKVYHYSIKG